jgi:transposase
MTAISKKQLLKQQGVLNRRSSKVIDPSFRDNSFFDSDDLTQVKYEMVRQVVYEKKSVSEAAKNFGLSRPALYQAKDAIEREGLLGLAPHKSGPKTRHKLNNQIMRYINEQLDKDSSIGAPALSDLVQETFSVSIHPRSIKRALEAQKKTTS